MAALLCVAWEYCESLVYANPAGGTVAQGSATFSTTGSQLTINTSANTFINWQSFNINAGETTTFVEPSASSVVFNHINDANPSQILGTLNANGYVILQNQSGFYVGGSAAINTAGLIMTTAHATAPTLASGGAWTFTAPPPTAQIINYGKISIAGGGSAFLIANDIENNGIISALGGKIGLYAGEQVLVSLSPDGRGVSALVTLPQGSVDNQGNLIADGGAIAAQAQTVNQGGLVEANTVRNNNGVIELVASDSLTLGANSDIEAHGDNSAANSGPSPGGFVVLQGGNTFADSAGSKINVAGGTGTAGGVDGVLEVFGNNVTDASSIRSQVDGLSAAQFGAQDLLLINPFDLTLSSNPSDTASANPNLNVGDLASYSQIDLHALDNIEVSAILTLTDPGIPASVNLTAGNSLILDNGSGINAGPDWNVNLTAGAGFAPTSSQPKPASGSDGIYLNGNSDLQTENGNINLWAANEVLLTASSATAAGNDGIRTLEGGNIDVTAVNGDVNTGANPQGFDYQKSAPYYTVWSSLGGISTVAGGNVTINAGGNVISYLPSGSTTVAAEDGGTGAFGPESGNVTITAGGNVYGHYVLANGLGTITAGNTIGAPNGEDAFALSLIDGTWNVNAPDGNIYLQEVRNPNGDFNNLGGTLSPGNQLFNYGSQATVDLTAGDGVYLTDLDYPRLASSPIQVIYPPILDITAGAGGVTLQDNVTLFPAVDQNLNITTTDGGSLMSAPNNPGAIPELLMSDSSNTRWNGSSAIVPFSDADNGAGVPVQAGNPNPVAVNISGNMEDLNLITSKATEITVGGDMINCGFSGQNLHASDVTSITVAGQIYNVSPYSFYDKVTIPSVPATDLLPGMGSAWNDIFTLAVNQSAIANLTIPAGTPTSQWAAYALENASVFGVSVQNGQYNVANAPNFFYNPSTGQLGYSGQMGQSVKSALGTPAVGTQVQSIYVLHLVNGVPVMGADGHLVLDTVNWAPASVVAALYDEALNAPSATEPTVGYRLGGPGQFDINAGSISLGNSSGILSCGVTDPNDGFGRYQNLVSITPSGATVNVTAAGDLDMLTSTIAALGGGNVNVTSTGGSMDLGLQQAPNAERQVGFGIFTSGNGNVNVTALGDINIDGSRIATFNGGNINVESLDGTVNVGSGGDTFNGVYVSYVDPATGQPGYYAEDVYGSGILANTLVPSTQVPLPPGSASVPGNVTVETPRGNIVATLGGITQEALDGNTAAGPIITLIAGTAASGTVGSPNYSPGYGGNIDLGQSGVIGGTVNLTANGNITADLVISRQNSTIAAAQNFNGSVLSAGLASVSGGNSVVGIIVGVGGANVSGASVTADVLGQNVSVNGGASQSTLGATASATSASQSAANQSETQAKEQLASNDDGSDDDKKNKKLHPTLQRVKRVTVILPDRL